MGKAKRKCSSRKAVDKEAKQLLEESIQGGG